MHEENWHKIIKALPKLPPFLIFHGEEGIGKSQFAKKLAAHILNTTPLQLTTKHEYRLIEGQSEIKLDTLKPVRDFLEHRYELPKILIVDNADQLNTHAANSLLKLFERQYENTFIILIVHNINKFPITLRSRFFEIPFHSTTNSLLENWLMKNAGLKLHLQQLLELPRWSSAHDQMITKYKEESDMLIRLMRTILYENQKITAFQKLNQFVIYAQDTHLAKEDFLTMAFLMGSNISLEHT